MSIPRTRGVRSKIFQKSSLSKLLSVRKLETVVKAYAEMKKLDSAVPASIKVVTASAWQAARGL